MVEDKEQLLNLLNSYGNDFMASFDPSIFSGKRKSEPEAGPSSRRKKVKVEETVSVEDESEEEWTGFGGSDDEERSDEEDEKDVSEGRSNSM